MFPKKVATPFVGFPSRSTNASLGPAQISPKKANINENRALGNKVNLFNLFYLNSLYGKR